MCFCPGPPSNSVGRPVSGPVKLRGSSAAITSACPPCCRVPALDGPSSAPQVFKRAKDKEINIEITEKFKDRLVDEVPPPPPPLARLPFPGSQPGST